MSNFIYFFLLFVNDNIYLKNFWRRNNKMEKILLTSLYEYILKPTQKVSIKINLNIMF